MRKDGKSSYKALQEKLERMQSQHKRTVEMITSAIADFEKIISAKPMILNINEYGTIWKDLTTLKLYLKELELEDLRQ